MKVSIENFDIFQMVTWDFQKFILFDPHVELLIERKTKSDPKFDWSCYSNPSFSITTGLVSFVTLTIESSDVLKDKDISIAESIGLIFESESC